MKKIKKFEPPVIKKSNKTINPPPDKPPQNQPTVIRRRSPKTNTIVFDMRKKIYPDNRKDEDSQTEDIFFKMYA